MGDKNSFNILLAETQREHMGELHTDGRIILK
jgi:hypothetical protein